MARTLRLLTALTAAALAVVMSPPASAAAGQTASEVYRFSDGGPIPGAGALLVANDGGVTLRVNTVEVAPEAHTVWWVVFNNPEFCQDPFAAGMECGAGDLENAAVQASVLYAAGNVTGSSGRSSYGARLNVGDDSEALFGPGLLRPRTAEIHVVIRTHGPAIPGMVHEQISTFNGGCEDGQPNEGLCDDVQFAVFPQRTP